MENRSCISGESYKYPRLFHPFTFQGLNKVPVFQALGYNAETRGNAFLLHYRHCGSNPNSLEPDCNYEEVLEPVVLHSPDPRFLLELVSDTAIPKGYVRPDTYPDYPFGIYISEFYGVRVDTWQSILFSHYRVSEIPKPNTAVYLIIAYKTVPRQEASCL